MPKGKKKTGGDKKKHDAENIRDRYINNLPQRDSLSSVRAVSGRKRSASAAKRSGFFSFFNFFSRKKKPENIIEEPRQNTSSIIFDDLDRIRNETQSQGGGNPPVGGNVLEEGEENLQPNLIENDMGGGNERLNEAPPGGPGNNIIEFDPSRGRNDANNRANEPVEEEQEEEDFWRESQNPDDYIAKVPTNESFLSGFERGSRESVKMKPVFETHTFVHEREVDEDTGPHSFMGLRFTKLDPIRGRLTRRHIKIGFGSMHGRPMGTGNLMDEADSTADASTETPISMDNFNNVVGAIERTKGNIDAFSRRNAFMRFFGGGKQEGTEFSGKYNVLTNNCNDFVITMAKAAGAEVPAQLHKSIFGPYQAKKNLANAAEQGQLAGGTRVKQLGKVLGYRGQMSRAHGEGENRHEAGWDRFLSNYMDDVRRSLGIDGIDLTRVPELEELLSVVNQDALRLRGYLQRLTRTNRRRRDVPENLEGEITTITADVRRAIEFHTTKKHPRLNISLMRVEALANHLRELAAEPGEENKIGNLDEFEVNYALTTQTTEEKRYTESANTGGVEANKEPMQNAVLFVPGNVTSGASRGAGEVLLMEAESGSLIKSMDSELGMSEFEKSGNLSGLVANMRGNDGEKMTPYLERFVQARDYLSSDQTAKMATLCILQAMGLRALTLHLSLIWKLDTEAADYETKRRDIEGKFKRRNLEEETDARSRQLESAYQLLTIIKERVNIIKGERPEQRQAV